MADKPATENDIIAVWITVMSVGGILFILLMAQCGEHSDMVYQLDALQDDITALQEDIPNEIRRYYWLLRDLLLGLY